MDGLLRAHVLLSVTLCVWLAGCGGTDPRIAMLRSRTAVQKEIHQILVGVKDTASMAEAKTKLDDRYDHCERLAQKARELDRNLPPDVAEQMLREKKGLEQAVADTAREIQRIKELPGGKDFIER